jgi:hypothetical protein
MRHDIDTTVEQARIWIKSPTRSVVEDERKKKKTGLYSNPNMGSIKWATRGIYSEVAVAKRSRRPSAVTVSLEEVRPE